MNNGKYIVEKKREISMALDIAQELLKEEIEIKQGRPHRIRRRKTEDIKLEEVRAVDKTSNKTNASSVIRHDNPLIRQDKNQWITNQVPYSDSYMLTKLDNTLARLDEVQRNIDRLRAGIGSGFDELEKWQSTIDEMKVNLADQIEGVSEKNISTTAELVRGLELSMGRLATKKSTGKANFMLGVGLFISLVNTAGLVIIVLILLGIIR